MYLRLWEAATNGDEKFIEEVIEESKTLLLDVTIDGNSALHIAAKHNREQIAMQMSEAQPSLLTLANKSGDTPLHLASAAGHLRIVNLFIGQHRRLRQHHRASSGGVEEEEDEDENDVMWMATANKIGNTALHAAIIGGHLNVVDRLLATAPQLATMTNQAGFSALYMATERGLLDIVRRILRVSPAVSHEGLRGQTALHSAVLRSYEISRMILDKNPSCLKHQDASKSTPLHFAAASGEAKILRLLIEKNPSAVYMQDEEGFAIIHIAASVGNLDNIEVILEYCPDALEQKNNKGRNFVHVAVEKTNVKVVKYVLNSCSSAKELLNEQDYEGNTPLHLAVLARDPTMIHTLLSSRIMDTALANNSGFTPIDLASSKFRIEVSLRMYGIMTDLSSYGSHFSPQGVDHVRNQLQRKQDEEINQYLADHARNQLQRKQDEEINQYLADHVRNQLQRKQDEEINQYLAAANLLAVMAVLIATVTFAAAFTLPGGYKNDSESDAGMAILSSKASFMAFLISDTIAMASSITAGLVLICSGSIDRDVRLYSLETAMALLRLAIISMSVAFITGVYTVIERHSQWVVGLVSLIIYGLLLSNSVVILDFLIKDWDPEEVIREAKWQSKFMDSTIRGQAKWKSEFIHIAVLPLQIYLWWLNLPPTVTTLIQNYYRNYLIRLVEEPPLATLAKKWFSSGHSHHEF